VTFPRPLKAPQAPTSTDIIVQTELQEIVAGVEADQTQFKLIKRKFAPPSDRLLDRRRVPVRRRHSIASYLPQIMNQIGMTSQHDKTLINAIMSICNWITALISLFVIPKVKRRSTFLFSTITMTIAFTVWTALAASYSKNAKERYGIGVLAMMFLFKACKTLCWIPLVIAYPLETATTKQRANFFSFTMFSMNMASFIAQYLNPVGLDALKWRWYIIQIVFNTCLIVIIYFTWVETHSMTLEEIAEVFNGKENLIAARGAAEGALEKLDAKEKEHVHLEVAKSLIIGAVRLLAVEGGISSQRLQIERT
jgi:MFS family permease